MSSSQDEIAVIAPNWLLTRVKYVRLQYFSLIFLISLIDILACCHHFLSLRPNAALVVGQPYSPIMGSPYSVFLSFSLRVLFEPNHSIFSGLPEIGDL